MSTHSSILAGKIPWTEEPGRLQGHKQTRLTHTHIHCAHNISRHHAKIFTHIISLNLALTP